MEQVDPAQLTHENNKITMPKVTIGMPVYNGAKYIREALNSLLAQTFQDFELVISDNASEDSTEKICKEYAERDPRIIYHKQKTNIGSVKNFQFVLGCARGDMFMWHAADDKCDINYISTLVDVLENNPELVLASCDVKNISDGGTHLFLSNLTSIRLSDVRYRWNSIRFNFFRYPTSNIYLCIYGLFRTQVLQIASLNYRGLVNSLCESEIPFLAQIALRGQIASVPKELKTYRRHSESSFHQEQKRISVWHRLNNSVRISRCLMQIALESNLKTSFKCYCVLIVARDICWHVATRIALQLLFKKGARPPAFSILC